MKKIIDVRSDTVTQPTADMREAMFAAEVGDDVYGDDATVNRLEEMAARVMGKEAALFVASGTMGNQLAIMTHTRPGDEIIAGVRSHVIVHEVGAPARLSGVGYALVDNPDNILRPSDVLAKIRPKDLMSPPTTLLCLENALGDGNVVPVEDMQATGEAARGAGLSVHLDGARIFNAAAALGVEAKAIAAAADSVMFCLSKGLCAPVGSMLCGSREFVGRARKNRKMLGGGMRQAGFLAAAGIVSLEKMTARLHADHANAALLAQLLSDIPGVAVHTGRVKINMVFWSVANPSFRQDAFLDYLSRNGIKSNGQESPGEYRFVVHNDISREDVGIVARAVREYVATL